MILTPSRWAAIWLATALILAKTVQSFPHTVSHGWDWEHGNLVQNWSFENELEGWTEELGPGTTVDTRFKTGLDGFQAHTGLFAAKVVGDHSGTSRKVSLASGFIPIRNGQSYTLSFYLRSSGVNGAGFPILFMRRERQTAGTGATTVQGTDYAAWGRTTNGNSDPDLHNWTLYSMSFTASAEDNWLEVFLWASITDGTEGSYFFDDVVLEEGNLAPAEILARRSRIGHSIAYGDGFGRTLQEHIRLPTSTWSVPDYLLSGSLQDNSGRTFRSLLPSVQALTTLAPLADPLAFANSFYNGIDAPNADDFPFSEVQFAEDPSGRSIRSGSSGEVWRNGGGFELRTGYYFVNELTIPSSIESPSSVHAEGEYRFDWRRDEEHNFTLTWTNRKGLIIQSAVNAKADLSQWAVKRKEYYPSGRLRKVFTPLDAPGGAGVFAETWSYDAGGNLISSHTRDRGLLKFWYDRQGRLRFSQDEEQRLSNEWTYVDRDQLGNEISVGTQVISQVTQTIADLESYGTVDGIAKVERKGFLYGGLEGFEQRTGVALSTVLPAGITLAPSTNRLACSYHTNVDVGGNFSPAERLVAEFFEFDQRGQVTRQFKYVGTMTSSQKLHAMAHTYDEVGRPTSSVLFKSPLSGEISVRHDFTYDMLGRMVSVRGKNGTWVARYEYEKWGPLKSVFLGGDENKTNGLRVDYTYHIRGWLKDVKAIEVSTGKEVFAQYLGYEDRAVAEAGVPSLTEVRRNGQVTQQLYKLTSELDQPVRLVNYQYDEMGRMISADFQRNTATVPLDNLQRITYPLALTNVDDLDTRMDYDLNGRITGKRAGGIASADSAVYTYQTDSYKIDHVTGKFSNDVARDMSAAGTFDYDSRGAMVEDMSKGMKLVYGYDMMPTRIEVREPGSTATFVQYQFYDPNGFRTSQVTTSKRSDGIPNIVVGVAESAEDPGIYDYSDINLAYAGILDQLQAMPPAHLPTTVTMYVIPPAGTDEVSPQPDEFVFYSVGGYTVILDLEGVIKYSDKYYELIESFGGGQRIAAEHHVNFTGQTGREFHETFDEQGALAGVDTVDGLFGRGTKIGRVTSGNVLEFFIKNHEGSVVRTVSASGEFSQGAAYDYQPYGELKTLRDGTSTITEKWTGKQLLALSQLYYFGARFYDPELGVWLTPDAMHEFFNPYGRSGDPVNLVDPDGNCEIVCAMLIGAAVGAYLGGVSSNGTFNPYKWDVSRTWDEILIGGIAGGVAGGLGAYVGGPAMALNSSGKMAATGMLGLGKTAGLLASSTSGSFTSWALSGGEGEVRTNFGAFDVNWNEALSGEQPFNLHNPFDDDPFLQNVGDFSGWMTNVQDLHYLRNNFNDVGDIRNIRKNFQILGGDNPDDPTGKSVAALHLRGKENEHNLKMVETGKTFLQKEAMVKHHLDHIGRVRMSEIVTQPETMGTLNLVAAGKWNTVGGFLGNVGHGVTDVVPYFLFGNALNDTWAKWSWIYAAGAELSY